LLDQIRLYIEDGRLEKAEKLISKMEIQLKKIADSANQPLLFSMKLLVDTLNGNSKVEEINSFQNTLKDNDNPGNEHVNWYLARSYKILNEDELAINLQDKAKNTINALAENISNKEDRKYYHDIYFHKRIMEELEDGKPETEEKPETPSVFGFCPGCGFKNENSFVFCPSCGNDLKQ
jgi:hypothetical protein